MSVCVKLSVCVKPGNFQIYFCQVKAQVLKMASEVSLIAYADVKKSGFHQLVFFSAYDTLCYEHSESRKQILWVFILVSILKTDTGTSTIV